jgi:hypothetical protein
VAVGARIATDDRPTTPLAVARLAAPNSGPARATATIHAVLDGLVIDMKAQGLAPSPPDTFYTCWLVGPGDSVTHPNRVSVGSFTVGADGSANVRWTTGADLSRFPTLGVTREPADGNPLRQGPEVLQSV